MRNTSSLCAKQLSAFFFEMLKKLSFRTQMCAYFTFEGGSWVLDATHRLEVLDIHCKVTDRSRNCPDGECDFHKHTFVGIKRHHTHL